MAENQKQSRTNPLLLLGILVAVAVGVLLMLLVQTIQSETKVYVAKGDISAYSVLRPNQNITLKQVPKSSVTDSDLTESDFKKGETKITRLEVLDSQRLDARATVASSLNSTLGVVKKGEEQVVAINTTFKGIIAGITRPGSVVNVYNTSGGDDGEGRLVAENVKVLGVGSGQQVANNIVNGDGSAKQEEDSNQNGASILVIAVVKNDDVAALTSDQSVTMSLNPYLEFDSKGNVKDVGSNGLSSPSTTQTAPETSTEPDPEASTDETTTDTTTP